MDPSNYSPGLPPGRPRVARKIGPHFEQYDDSGSLASRRFGKVLIDCKFRFAESRWGTLRASKAPAGVIYIDLSFNQHNKYRLSSARVQISLQEYEKVASKKGNEKVVNKIRRRLAVTDEFGPKMLTGKPTTLLGKTSYSLTPQLSAMGTSISGIGINTEKTVIYSSQWVLNGYSVAGDRGGIPGAAYRTLRWELSENDLSTHAEHSNIFHTGLAFTHEARPFYIRVEIEGKLQKLSDRLRYLFPPRIHKDQGTALTRVDLGPEHDSGPPLDSLAQSLNETMVRRNLYAIPRETSDSLLAVSDNNIASGLAEVSEKLDQAADSTPEPMRKEPSAIYPSSPNQPSLVDKLSAAMPKSLPLTEYDAARITASSPAAKLSIEVPTSQDIPKEKSDMAEEIIRQLAANPSFLKLLHLLGVLLGLFGQSKPRPKVS